MNNLTDHTLARLEDRYCRLAETVDEMKHYTVPPDLDRAERILRRMRRISFALCENLMPDEPELTSPCPECTAEAGILSREKAFDAFLNRSAHPDEYVQLIERDIVRRFVGNRQDPTEHTELACGHVTL